MKLSVIVPCFNEAPTVRELLQRVRKAIGDDQEIIVVNDGSTDGSADILSALDGTLIDRLIEHPQNRGKGAALRSAFEIASGDLVLVQDADLEYDPADYPLLLQPLLDGKADVVYGSRFKGASAARVLYFWHYVANRCLTFCCNAFSNLNMTDIETCYKVFHREVLTQLELREDRFGIEPELTLKMARIPSIRVYEVGVSYAGRTYEEGKKIGWRDGVRALYCIARYGLLR